MMDDFYVPWDGGERYVRTLEARIAELEDVIRDAKQVIERQRDERLKLGVDLALVRGLSWAQAGELQEKEAENARLRGTLETQEVHVESLARENARLYRAIENAGEWLDGYSPLEAREILASALLGVRE